MLTNPARSRRGSSARSGRSDLPRQRTFLSRDYHSDAVFRAPNRAAWRYHGIKLSIPVTEYRFDTKTFSEGLGAHEVGKLSVKIYSPGRTVADCFEFRNKLGLDVAIEALRLARQRKRVQNREFLRCAKLLRVEKIISPYLQAIE